MSRLNERDGLSGGAGTGGAVSHILITQPIKRKLWQISAMTVTSKTNFMRLKRSDKKLPKMLLSWTRFKIVFWSEFLRRDKTE